ncbi:LysR family transcriptional regulator [Bradyrhizobium genosp. SA-3]|uniref:LysR family transcriptional regulator n=1 Tax=Bradyrhizobium genosp. SA-3 TaxID=508868 RepID=UPI0013EE4346|nr:LysR family transcriptional regulator [Bradyrhizobium genosp. SA-3]
MKLPPLQALRSFEAVARMNSVTRAAEELRVSHSAVSYQIRKLEEWMGLPLVERSGRGIRLTEAGERYRVKVCGAFHMIHGETELLRKRQASSLVHVSCLPLFTVSWLMPQIHDFWGKNPDVQIAVQYSRELTPIDPTIVDVAVQHGNPGEFPDFVALPLLEGTTIPVASPNYLQRNGYNDINDLSRLTPLHYLNRSLWRTWLQKAALDYDLDMNLADAGPVHTDANLTLAACLTGEGVALMPRSVMRLHLRQRHSSRSPISPSAKTDFT